MGVKLCQTFWNQFELSLNFDFHIYWKCAVQEYSEYSQAECSSFLQGYLFESQSKYCPHVWMFHGKQVNDKINYLDERALRMIYEDSTSLCDTLLEKDMLDRAAGARPFVTLYISSATAVPSLFLQYSNNRHTRLQSDFLVPQVNTVYFVPNSRRYLGTLI